MAGQHQAPADVFAAKRGQQHASLATGHWALATQGGIHVTHTSAGSTFDNASMQRNVAAQASSHDSWQVPVMQAQVSQRDNGESAMASCFSDNEHDKTSGLAPHDVLDFLGIGMSAERTNSMSQPVT